MYCLVQHGQGYELREGFWGTEDGVDVFLMDEQPARFEGTRDEILLALQAASNDVLWGAATLGDEAI